MRAETMARQHSSDEGVQGLFELSTALSGNSHGAFPDLARSNQGDGLANLPRAEADIGPGGGTQDRDSDLSPGQVLSVPKVLISRDEHLIASTFRWVELLHVLLVRPALLSKRVYSALVKVASQTCRSALIEQEFQRATATRRALASCSSTARTCCSSTPGNHSTNSLIVAPRARFS